MDDNDWDLNSILQRFKASTFTPPTPPIETPTPPPQTPITNSPQMTTAPSFDEAFPFTISQENDLFPFTQPNPNDFLELDQLLMDFINPTPFTNTTTTTLIGTNTSGHGINPNSTFSDLSDLIGQQQMMVDQGLYHLVTPPTTYTPIPPTYTPIPIPIEPPANTFNTFYHQYQQQQPQQRQQEPYYQLPVQVPLINSMVSPNTQPQPQQAPKSRRRKGQEPKNVQKMTREKLFNDVWAWRKYGQKPIKGSPYPRHYYKCSSLKGCEARKHVEKSTTEEDMFNVTFVGVHNHAQPTHRNTLSGTTRRKSSATRLPAAIETGSLLYAETGTPSNSVFPPPIILQFDKPDNGVTMVAASEPEIPNVEMEPYYNDFLIPNLDAMSDAFLFDIDHFYGGAVPSVGSDPNSSTGFNRVRF